MSQAYELNDEGYRLYKGIATPLNSDEDIACPYCKEFTVSRGDVDWCRSCDVITEGESIILSEKEWDTI